MDGGVFMGNSILFVDDEHAILRALNRLFREKEYTLFMAESGQEALKILENNPVDLIVSDMRMPQMNGHQLLKIVKEKYPATMRLILSGYTQEKEIFRSLLDGSSKMYLLKPWDNDTLLGIVDNVFQIIEMLRNKHLLEQVEQMENLPTLPNVYSRLCVLIEQEADIKQIAALIEWDQVIAAKVLHLANSAFMGVKTGSVQQAISYLGLSIVKSIVLASSVLDEKGISKVVLGKQELLWKHASLTNKIFVVLAERLQHKKVADECAAAGLLHDIGKIILLKQYPEQYIQILNLVEETTGNSLKELEQPTLNITHGEIGGYLLNLWQLPYSIVEAALFHHYPTRCPVINKEIVYLVHLASYYSWRKISANFCDELDLKVFELLKTSPEKCEEWIQQIEIV
jgi:HD-like signal output (HDOD) protein